MLVEPQDIAQVVGSDLDGGLAHFVGSLRDGMLLLLDDQDAGGGTALFELQSQCQASDPTAQDGHIILLRRGINGSSLLLYVLMVFHLATSCLCRLCCPSVIQLLSIGFTLSSCR